MTLPRVQTSIVLKLWDLRHEHASCQFELSMNVFNEFALALHALTKTTVVNLSTVRFVNVFEHLVCSAGVVRSNPFFEDLKKLSVQTNNDW